MLDLASLPSFDASGHLRVVVEAPRGARVKLAYDAELRAFVFQRELALGMSYPYDWGFVPSTRAEDGDPLDAMVLLDGATWPGTIIPCIPIGIVRIAQRRPGGRKEERNDRIIAVAVEHPRYTSIEEIPRRLRDQLVEFFLATGRLTGKTVSARGWGGPAAALRAVRQAAERFARQQG